ncbi:MAG TPA: FAD-dependent thymidylate synthase [Spirochaetota bacterium]|nr:FAD-dependent thymidylate synthase [Spirochaetota bacterium]HPF06455.1 FAD-dependent thymidylate synthase [Spirochaetota bacterium]HPJ42888.1 FAD-dependent thymidylate synthase [Spirochaetota bacterium]HPR37558.1 FAD-dependent thymidylate synthase [Spirochaetota bacterium]HRX47641.1 FAD-dependent thymidylate synthase [Spirochaetota bacterium]
MEIHKPEVILLAITPNPEKLIEEAGRTCYLSLSKITDDSERNFIRSAIKRGHHSILEHASASFRILGASRSFTHQLVRHRIASFSQQSQRYVDEAEFNYIVPPDIAGNETALAVYREFIENSRETYAKFRELGIKKEDARFILPNALESQIVFSANFREFRSVFNLRLDKAAQWEIRRVCLEMLKILQDKAPSVFGDYVINEDDWTAETNLI